MTAEERGGSIAVVGGRIMASDNNGDDDDEVYGINPNLAIGDDDLYRILMENTATGSNDGNGGVPQSGNR